MPKDPFRSKEGVSDRLNSKRPVEISANPSVDYAKNLVQDALRKAKAVIIIGLCEILYKGRASSALGAGERVVLITADKALIIHRSHGYRPVNWQPTGCRFRVEQHSDNRLEVTAVRMRPLESVKITFSKLYLVCVLGLSDESEILMHGSELEMKKAILCDPSLIEEGFVPITSEKEMPTGFADIFGKDRNGNYTIIEIKRGKATKEAALQLSRYVETIRKGDPSARGILIAESMAKGTQKSIALLNLEYKRLNPRKCSEVLRKTQRNEEEEISDYF